MTNNNTTIDPTITLNTSTHGTFKVSVDHLHAAMVTRRTRKWEALFAEVTSLTGFEGDYSDLAWIELMILISYLTGGSVD